MQSRLHDRAGYTFARRNTCKEKDNLAAWLCDKHPGAHQDGLVQQMANCRLVNMVASEQDAHLPFLEYFLFLLQILQIQ